MGEARLLVMGYQGTLRPAQRQNLPAVFESLLQPWLAQASQLLNQRIPGQQRIFQGEPIPLESLLLLLEDRLIGMLTQVLRASGNASFEPSANKIADEFPLLSSLMRHAVSEWAAAVGTFLQRLHRDQSWLAGAMPGGKLLPIESVSGAASDIHSGGHFVLRVGFSGGGCLYYKPRPLTGEWLWHGLLNVIAGLDPHLSLPTSRVFTREIDGRYGWATSVLPDEKFSEAPVPAATEYWHAAGAMLCLAQHARLTDLHLANIIATPRGPAVTDAECFATPTLSQPRPPMSGPHVPIVLDAFEAILATGLLPRKQDSNLPEVSGLFGHAAPVPGIRLSAWSLSSDGRYDLNPVAAELVDHGNTPVQTTPTTVLAQMLSGYRHAADLLIRARRTLLAPGSQWRSVLEKKHAPRFVLRDTLTYGCLLSQSLEPQSLRSNYRRRNVVLTELQSYPNHNFVAAVMRAECNAILHLHVPRFTILPGSRTVGSGSGRVLTRRFATSTPDQSVLQSIESLTSGSVENLHVPALLAAIL
ncbi:MAG: DUF4135 domain-containing protein [Acidobacteriota bacterium]